MYSNIHPIYAVWWFKLVTNVVLNLCAYVIYQKCINKMLFLKYKIFHQMSSQNAGNVISEPPIVKNFPWTPIRVTKYEPPPDKTKTLRLWYGTDRAIIFKWSPEVCPMASEVMSS